MKIIDEQLMNDLAEQAKKSPRLRMNYNFHQSLLRNCSRMRSSSSAATWEVCTDDEISPLFEKAHDVENIVLPAGW